MPGTHPFTPMQLLELRSEMEQDFARLLRSADAEQVHGALSDNEAWRPEPDSYSAAPHDPIVKAQSQARLMAVTAALRRLDSGAYGECVRCGNRISFDRLSAMPAATLCSACAGS
jgi:RNA polymerase-binding transcription factor DksA